MSSLCAMTSHTPTSTADPLLVAAGREVEEFEARKAKQAPLTPAVTDETPDPIPFWDPARELQDINEVKSSELYSSLDRAYYAPKFPLATCGRVTDLRKDPLWYSLLLFAHFRRIVMDSDAIEAHVQWMRDIISYLRYHEVLPAEYTSERAATRIVSALAGQHRFRQHMRRLRAASLHDFPDLVTDVIAYICYNHDSTPYERRHTRRRVVLPAEHELPEPGPSTRAVKRAPAQHSDCDPPPFKARLHKAALENLGDDVSGSKWNPVVFDSFGQARKLKDEGASAPQQRLGVLQAILRLIKEQQCVEMPYFDGLSEARLRDVLEKDAGFTAVMDELLRAADSDYTSFAPTLRRIVNHLCQPRKRTSDSSRQVRFAPF